MARLEKKRTFVECSQCKELHMKNNIARHMRTCLLKSKELEKNSSSLISSDSTQIPSQGDLSLNFEREISVKIFDPLASISFLDKDQSHFIFDSATLTSVDAASNAQILHAELSPQRKREQKLMGKFLNEILKPSNGPSGRY
jgi:hypothetical protein